MQKLTASNLVAFIKQLDNNAVYNYINSKNKGLIKIEEVQLPEGPIRIKRWDPSKGEVQSNRRTESISVELIWRIANAFSPGSPINFDRVLGGSYNTRSVLESLLVNSPQFYFCYPGRIENNGGSAKIKRGHKHIIWTPENPHALGKAFETNVDIVISEINNIQVQYDSLVLPNESKDPGLDYEVKRRHAHMQISLYHIGKQLGFRTWIAQNDKGMMIQNRRFGEFEGVISSLKDEKLISSYEDAIRAALMIDCIWFKNGRLMPAVIEVEHSTGVTSGLTRMKTFKDKFPPFPTRYVIVASDDERHKVIKEANKDQFRDLNTRFFPYSAVEELSALCQKRKITGVTEEFLDSFMEPVLIN